MATHREPWMTTRQTQMSLMQLRVLKDQQGLDLGKGSMDSGRLAGLNGGYQAGCHDVQLHDVEFVTAAARGEGEQEHEWISFLLNRCCNGLRRWPRTTACD